MKLLHLKTPLIHSSYMSTIVGRPVYLKLGMWSILVSCLFTFLQMKAVCLHSRSTCISWTWIICLKLDNLQAPGSFKIRGIGNTCQKALENGFKRLVGSSGGRVTRYGFFNYENGYFWNQMARNIFGYFSYISAAPEIFWPFLKNLIWSPCLKAMLAWLWLMLPIYWRYHSHYLYLKALLRWWSI